MHFLLHDIRYAFRMLRRSPGFTAVALLALGLGIGANTAIFSVVHGVLLEPLPYKDPEQLVLLHDNFRKLDILKLAISPPEYFDYRDRTRSFQNVAAFAEGNANLTGGSEPERVSVANVTASFFPLLGSVASHGRTFSSSEETPGNDRVVVLSHALWMRRFSGEHDAIGKSIVLEGESYRIVGVMPPEFDFPSKSDLWAPLALDPRENSGEQRAGRWLSAIARLKPGVTTEAAHADLKRLAGELVEAYPKNYPDAMGFETSVETLDDATVGEVRPALRSLVGAVGLVLLIACANVANLLLGRGSSRGRELALRAALGARRGRIVRLLLTESLLLSIAGGALGLLLALWGIDLLRIVAPESLPRMERIEIDGMVLAYTLCATVVTAILFGLIPALRASRVRVSSDLKGAISGDDGGRRRLRNGLVVAELAMALILLVGSGLMLRSFIRLNNVPPGFDASNVLTMKLALPATKYAEGPATQNIFNEILTRLRSLPGIASASVASIVPVEGDGLNRSFQVEEQKSAEKVSMPVSEWRIVSPDYFATMRIPLLAGRDFTDRDRDSSEGVVIVNRALAERMWPGANPIGKKLMFFPPPGDPWRTVVGVVGDVRQFGLEAKPEPEIYSPHAQFPVGEMMLALRGDADPIRLLSAVRGEIAALDRDLPLANIATMDERLSRSVVGRRLNMVLLLIFGGVALLLAAIGAYGVISYGVAQRTREFGIRMALGARGSDLLRMVLRQGMTLTLIGLGAGLVGAWGVTRLIGSLLYEVDPLDPITYGAVALLLAAVAFLACYIPARRASSVDPMVALRYE